MPGGSLFAGDALVPMRRRRRGSDPRPGRDRGSVGRVWRRRDTGAWGGGDGSDPGGDAGGVAVDGRWRGARDERGGGRADRVRTGGGPRVDPRRRSGGLGGRGRVVGGR